MTDTRSITLDILVEYSGSKAFLADIIRGTQEKYAYLEERDRAFIKNLATGTVEKQIALDHVINSVSKVRTGKMKPLIRNIIRMASYEIIYMDHIPSRASVNEAVRLTKKKHIPGLSGFVNAVTRNIAKLFEEGRISFPDAKTAYSCPDALYEILCEDHGQEAADDIIRACDERPGQYLRVNTSITDMDRVKERLKKEGVEYQESPFCVNALKVIPFNPSEHASFREGLYSMQDAGSMAAIEALSVSEGLEVIDMCASPGGKACYVSELMKGTGRVRAFDISDEKKSRIDENIKRLRLDNIQSLVKDATLHDESLEKSADIVIADLPCSGLGVMGRKVDIKYRVTKEDIIELARLQRQILDNAVAYMKDDGRLLFSTCTLTRQETTEQRDYIKEHFALELLCERQFIEGRDDCDGFYYAIFRR